MSIVMITGTGTVGGTSETAILSTQPTSNTTQQGGGFRLSGMLAFTGNASASTVTIKVRQGTGTSGTVIYTSPAITVAAAAVMAVPYDCQDTTQGVNTYTVTATFSGAPAASGAVAGTLTISDVAYYAD